MASSENCGRSDDEPPPPPPPVTTVDVTAARELMAAGGGHHRHRFLDVRTEEELARLGHLVEPDRSLNVPYMFAAPQGGGGGRVKNAHFLEQVASLLTKDDHILVGCQSGKRSELACLDLQAAGFKNVKNMGGGYLAWIDHGFPVHHGTTPPRAPRARHNHQQQQQQQQLEHTAQPRVSEMK